VTSFSRSLIYRQHGNVIVILHQCVLCRCRVVGRTFFVLTSLKDQFLCFGEVYAVLGCLWGGIRCVGVSLNVQLSRVWRKGHLRVWSLRPNTCCELSDSNLTYLFIYLWWKMPPIHWFCIFVEWIHCGSDSVGFVMRRGIFFSRASSPIGCYSIFCSFRFN